MRHRNGFVTYVNAVAVDLASIAIVGLLILVVFFAFPSTYRAEDRMLPTWLIADSKAMPNSIPNLRALSEYNYPMQKEPLSSWACGFVAVGVPWLVIGLFQIKLRSLWDWHAGTIGIVKAVVAASFVTTVLKHFVGGFRPYFLAACNANISKLLKSADQQMHWFNPTFCEGNQSEIQRALQGFPSGHTSSTFAAAIFLALYLNGKLKAFADYSSEFWTLMVTIAPLIGASLVAGSMYVTHQHHAHEIIFGIVIGLLLGTLSYRSTYAALLDFRYNHIPLPPFSLRTRFTYQLDAPHIISATTQDLRGAEDDSLVAWSWWQQSGVTTEGQGREIAWLRSLRSLRVTARELQPVYCISRKNTPEKELSEELEISQEVTIEQSMEIITGSATGSSDACSVHDL